MLSKADVNISEYLPIFAEIGVPVAFLVPTETGYGKSIMDATAPVRKLLKDAGIHDYDIQGQGPENKEIVKSFFVEPSNVKETQASLYRPVTKKGDPRIWFSGLKNYCLPYNLLALVIINGAIYVFNLSDPFIATSLLNRGEVYYVLSDEAQARSEIAEELLDKIKAVHNQGFLRSITQGDPGVGDTLEHALGIDRNNLQKPDYKGIELKATRVIKAGVRRTETRSTLFAKVPDGGYTYRDLLMHFGKSQIPRGMSEERFQLECTLKASKKNSHDLKLFPNTDKDLLYIQHENDTIIENVSFWYLETLRSVLAEKHHETFWVKATSDFQDGIEYFRYDLVLHTKNPNLSLFAPLIETDVITLDLLAYLKDNGTCRDHGALFKMFPKDLHLLLGDEVKYDLTK